MVKFKKDRLTTINIACGYSAVYAGNFIPSVLSIATKLKKNYKVIFSFPKTSEKRNWISVVKTKFDTYFFDNDNKFNRRRDLKKINKLNNVSLLYTNFFSSFLVQTLYLFKSMKLVIHVLSDFSQGKKMPLTYRLKIFFAERILHRKTKFIYCSKLTFEKSKAKNKFYVPSGLSVERIISNGIDVPAFREKNNIMDNNYVFLLFGWSPMIKGIDIAVKALARCVEHGYQNFKMIIVHGKDDGKEKLILFLESICLKDILESNVILAAPTDDVFSYYKIANCFVSASRSEGFPYSVLEALYAKKRVIVSNIFATKWALKYKTVTEFASENHDDLAAKMIDAYNNRIGYDIYESVSKDVFSEYNVGKWSDEIIDIIGKE